MRSDILLDDGFDLLIAGGDLVAGSSAQQEVQLLVMSQKGAWRQYPTIGFGVDRFLKKSTGPVIADLTARQRFIRELTIELAVDGQLSPVIDVNDDLSDFKVYIDP